MEATYTVQITYSGPDAIAATVTGGKAPYSVVLTAAACRCACPDHLWRGHTCKHASQVYAHLQAQFRRTLYGMDVQPPWIAVEAASDLACRAHGWVEASKARDAQAAAARKAA